jgi:hypothetical protein
VLGHHQKDNKDWTDTSLMFVSMWSRPFLEGVLLTIQDVCQEKELFILNNGSLFRSRRGFTGRGGFRSLRHLEERHLLAH